MYASGPKTFMAITLRKGKLIPKVPNQELNMSPVEEAGRAPQKIAEALVVSIFCLLFEETIVA